MKARIPGLAAVTLALAGLSAMSNSAQAAFVTYICDDVLCTGGGDTIVTDQGPGDNFRVARRSAKSTAAHSVSTASPS